MRAYEAALKPPHREAVPELETALKPHQRQATAESIKEVKSAEARVSASVMQARMLTYADVCVRMLTYAYV
jgi:hypothetical protein